MIGASFLALSLYIAAQFLFVLVTGYHAKHSPLGVVWTGVTAIVMFALSAGKARTVRALHNPVLLTEGRVTTIDALLARAVLFGLALNAAFGLWWLGWSSSSTPSKKPTPSSPTTTAPQDVARSGRAMPVGVAPLRWDPHRNWNAVRPPRSQSRPADCSALISLTGTVRRRGGRAGCPRAGTRPVSG